MLPRIWPAVLTLGWILGTLAAAEVAMALYSLTAKDGFADVFAESAAVTFLVACACILTTKGRRFELGFRDAAVLTVVAWGAVPAFAALPLLASPIGLSAVDAYFEMVSGITTTGSTVLTGLDAAPPTVLLWRSTVQWIGGIGIIGIAILVLPFLKIGGMQLFRLESSDRSDKAIPRLRSVALTIGEIYLLLTVACLAGYWLLGMTFFDALNHALTTLATGGFSTHDASFGYFDEPALQWAGTVFMTLAALPFLAYYRLLHHHGRQDRLDPQAMTFVATLVVLSILFALWLHGSQGIDAATALTLSAFNIVSVVTTTGFASADYLMWGAFASTWFFALTFVGGCTGSTTGAIKIFRFQVVAGMVLQHLRTVFTSWRRSVSARAPFPTPRWPRWAASSSSIFCASRCSQASSRRSDWTQRRACPPRQRRSATLARVSAR